MCGQLLRYLNARLHARHSVKHINETDYAATVWPGFVLTDVAATKDPHRGYLRPGRRGRR